MKRVEIFQMMREREEDGLIGTKARDSGIKLFGRTIPFSATATPTPMEVKGPCSDFTKPEQEKSSALRDNGENLHLMDVNNPEANLQNNEENSVDVKEDDKMSKKPAKAVPCPRCNSYETKFCYFNNYNVNQPRHFCKNCHRYWTAGGTMRNVPVGAGKRRNKPLPSQFFSSSDSANHPLISAVVPSTSSVTLPKFRPEKTLCKSMDSAIDEPSTSGSSTTTPTNVINEFSEMVDVGEGYFVKKKQKWCSENGNGNDSGVMGNHCRDAKLVEEDELERCVSVPKTLRVDDPKDSNLGLFRL